MNHDDHGSRRRRRVRIPATGRTGANALGTSGIVRSDIRSSFSGVSGTAQGVPLTIELTLVDATSGCAPLVGYAIYVLRGGVRDVGLRRQRGNLRQTSLSSDMVFGDGVSSQLAAVTGNVTDGYVAKLTIGIAP